MTDASTFIIAGGSTHGPGVIENSEYGPVSAYEVWTVPKGTNVVLEYVSATVYFGSDPYPPDRIGDIGFIGFKSKGKDYFHLIPFFRKEPGGMLFASQAVPMHIPAGAKVIVKVPLVPGQTGGASITLSGYENR